MNLFGFKSANEERDSLQTAKAAVKIIDSGIKKDDLTIIPEKLEAMPQAQEPQEVYVFYGEEVRSQIVILVICAILALLFAGVLFVGMSLLALSNEFEMIAATMIAGSLSAIVINIAVIITSVKDIQFQRRFAHYYEHLKHHRIEATDDLVEITGYPKRQVIGDLKQAIKKRYIPEGHFGRNNFVFMVSDEVYDLYQQKPAVFEHYFKQRIEERERMRGRNANIQRILDTGKDYIDKIHDSNDLIQDKDVSDKLDRMEKTVSMIFKEVDLNPRQADKLGMFLNYYLPTTEKLLKKYIEITEKGIEGSSLSQTKRDLAKSLDTINDAFGRILELLYVEQEADVISDIETMETMMSSEGLVER